MQLLVCHTIPCDIATAFAWLTSPPLMNQWSTARISMRSPGEHHHPAGMGALRRVTLPFGKVVLNEVVLASEPPYRFVYRVYDTALVESHEGSMSLSEVAGGTEVRWHVRMNLSWGALERHAKPALLRELERSLDALDKCVGGQTVAPEMLPPPHRALPPSAAKPALLLGAQQCRDDQRDQAQALRAAGDARHWFTQVYAYVSDTLLSAVTQGVFTHPEWVLRLIDSFHGFYQHSLAAEHHPAEEHWRRAFAAMQRAARRYQQPYEQMMRCVWHGMRAHIEDDLPRALGTVHGRHFSDCDYARFRGDYIRMAPLFRNASERMLAEVGAQHVPRWIKALDVLLPVTLKDMHMARVYYDIPKQRMQAFDRGAGLSALLAPLPLPRAGQVAERPG